MRTIKIKTQSAKNSLSVHEWSQKEYGSWEDHNEDPGHASAILRRFKNGTTELTEQEAETLIESGKYQSSAWNEDEINGGKRTMETIARYVDKLEYALKELTK